MTEVHCLLHPKERFTASKAGAFSLNVLQSSLCSEHLARLTVFGVAVTHPFEGVRFRTVTAKTNIGFALAYARLVRHDPPAIIECFNRPQIASLLARGFAGQSKVTVYFGNDPQGMRGTRTVASRQHLLSRLSRIYCVSDFIRQRFLDGVSDPEGKCVVLYTGISPPPPVPKEPLVVFAGRMMPEKGVLPLVAALAEVLPRYPTWKAVIIGANWFDADAEPSPYERAVMAAAKRCPAIRLTGFLPNAEAMRYYQRAAVAAVPSDWDDPFPRSALEALAAGCALICSTRGGLLEIGTRAHFVQRVDDQSLKNALTTVLGDDAYRAELQRRAATDLPFTLQRSVHEWDQHRSALLATSSEPARVSLAQRAAIWLGI
jgi:glycosyltransferase involved in cell wall biosynthesis